MAHNEGIMEKNIKVIFTNEDAGTIDVCFEPEGLTLPLPATKSVEFDVTTDGTPLQIFFVKQQGTPYISVWEETGCRYVASYDGKNIEAYFKNQKD
jgi:hypothetical protein